jgi:hypothetical protein
MGTDQPHFVRFQEENDWEGETWNFWLPLDGNEDELLKLAALIAGREEYRLGEQGEPEAIVDKLIQYGESGYFAQHNKSTGRLTCPTDIEKLYKGGVRDCFGPAQPALTVLT